MNKQDIKKSLSRTGAVMPGGLEYLIYVMLKPLDQLLSNENLPLYVQ